MKYKVFIDGSSGTTGLRIADRLAKRPELELLHIPETGRKDLARRAETINAADLAFLCLPDAAAVDWETYQEEQYDKLAAGVRASLDMDRVYRILNGEE